MKDNAAASKSKFSPRDMLTQAARFFSRYAVIWFVLLLVGVYGFVLYQIQAASTAQPTEDAVSAKVQAAPTPHVDPSVVDQLQSLQDHSVNVKTLFDAARDNPFQE